MARGIRQSATATDLTLTLRTTLLKSHDCVKLLGMNHEAEAARAWTAFAASRGALLALATTALFASFEVLQSRLDPSALLILVRKNSLGSVFPVRTLPADLQEVVIAALSFVAAAGIALALAPRATLTTEAQVHMLRWLSWARWLADSAACMGLALALVMAFADPHVGNLALVALSSIGVLTTIAAGRNASELLHASRNLLLAKRDALVTRRNHLVAKYRLVEHPRTGSSSRSWREQFGELPAKLWDLPGRLLNIAIHLTVVSSPMICLVLILLCVTAAKGEDIDWVILAAPIFPILNYGFQLTLSSLVAVGVWVVRSYDRTQPDPQSVAAFRVVVFILGLALYNEGIKQLGPMDTHSPSDWLLWSVIGLPGALLGNWALWPNLSRYNVGAWWSGRRALGWIQQRIEDTYDALNRPGESGKLIR